MEPLTVLRVAGLLGVVGALLYIVGDALLLAVRAAPERHPRLGPHAAVVGSMAKLAELDDRRIATGGLVGVLSTPLVLLGWWVVYRALEPAGPAAAAVPTLAFITASVIGGFAHGWFMALAESIRLLDRAPDATAGAVAAVVARQSRILAVAFIPVGVAAVVGSVLYSIVVLGGSTALPTWMAAVNPLAILAVFLVVRRILPARLADPLQGTGFSVAYLVLFLLTTVAVWNGVA
jgi:hypothetical protein